MNLSDNISDAKFRNITTDEDDQGIPGTKIELQLPATQDDLKYLRHPLAKLDQEYATTIMKEIDLDRKLCLDSQTDLDQNALLRKDIDELTRSNNYFQVTKKHLKKLFKISQLRSLCFLPNLIEFLVQTLKGLLIPAICFVTAIFFSIVCIHFSYLAVHLNGTYQGKIIILAVCLGICTVVPFVMGITSFFDGGFMNGRVDFEYCFMKVRLNLESIKETKIKIPYQAKLKLVEAVDSKLFEGFSIAYPEFYSINKNYKPLFKLPKLDPAILGITKDTRQYMVCWWDIKHDVDRVKMDIKKFKQLKII